MPEQGEQQMSRIPEGEPVGALSEQQAELSVDDKLRSLIEGETPEIKDPRVRRLITSSLHSKNQNPEDQKRIWVLGDNFYIEGSISEEDWAKASPLFQEKGETFVRPKTAGSESVPQTTTTAETMEKLAEAVVKLGEQIASGGTSSDKLLRQQAEQSARLLEALRGGGYDSLVSTENAQAPLSWESFEGQQLAWYRELNEEWQTIIRNRLTILTACYIKRSQGHLNLDAVAQNERARIDTRALDLMWEKMPEFRIALATMMNKFFEIREEVPPGLDSRDEKNKVRLLVLKGEVFENGGPLVEFEKYKKELAESLTEYLREHPEVSKREEGAPRSSPEVAARAGVAAAWNFLYLGNVIESADQGDLSQADKAGIGSKENLSVGRKAGNSITYAEQIRAMMLPFDKAWSKTAKDTVGTEETWLGDLGDYVAERNRHDTNFKLEFARRRRRIVPQRLFASLLDLFTYKDGGEKVSLGIKLYKDSHSLGVGDLKDYDHVGGEDSKIIHFASGLGYDELWGVYADKWDSAKKIYEMLGGKKSLMERDAGIRPWRQTLATSLQKLRNSPIGPYFRDPELLVGCLAGSVGLTEFTSGYVLSLNENDYDSAVTAALDDDRFFVESGSRGYVFDKLNAKDERSILGFLGGFLPRRRLQLKLEAQRNAAKFKAR